MAHRQPLASHLHGAFRLIAHPYGKSGLWPSVEAGQRTVSNHTNITISGLTPFTVYTFRVVAINALGHSRPSTVSYPVNTQRELAPVSALKERPIWVAVGTQASILSQGGDGAHRPV
ncbi:hypothetical protein FJT64_021258 [Amphibalanus amphitrite]|uniref:Fibronectin type-III domain-containing protein n=1 Tax=Amphibalanus amphitrite TaxID=1232801 RepID=A0A6A4WUU2_AMPAM|nr:hypothetical protein FJT64_021258 [Amphibalanus amphitrite]